MLVLLAVLGAAYLGLAYLFPEVMLFLAVGVVAPVLLVFLKEWLDERK